MCPTVSVFVPTSNIRHDLGACQIIPHRIQRWWHLEVSRCSRKSPNSRAFRCHRLLSTVLALANVAREGDLKPMVQPVLHGIEPTLHGFLWKYGIPKFESQFILVMSLLFHGYGNTSCADLAKAISSSQMAIDVGFYKWRYAKSWIVYFMENPSIHGW